MGGAVSKPPSALIATDGAMSSDKETLSDVSNKATIQILKVRFPMKISIEGLGVCEGEGYLSCVCVSSCPSVCRCVCSASGAYVHGSTLSFSSSPFFHFFPSLMIPILPIPLLRCQAVLLPLLPLSKIRVQ